MKTVKAFLRFGDARRSSECSSAEVFARADGQQMVQLRPARVSQFLEHAVAVSCITMHCAN